MSDALDATAEALSRRLLATAPADRPRTALDVDGFPAPVARLLQVRLAEAVEEAAPQGSEWIGGSDVEAAANTWREAAARAVRFPASAWAEAVRQSSWLALAHLVRPAATLADVAFDGQPGPLPADVALGRIQAFGPYPYLPQIAARYVERKGLDTIGRGEFAGLLQRIDRRMVSTFGPDDWMTLLGPLVALVGRVASPPGSIPTGLLRPLFRAKGADALADALEGVDAVTPDELRDRLGQTLSPAETPPVETAPETPSVAEAAPEASPADDGESESPVATEPETEPSLETEEAEPETPSQDEIGPVVEVTPLDDDERPQPPTVGSLYHSPEYDGIDESEVIGTARPALATPPEPDDELGEDEPDDDEEGAMQEVRDALRGSPEPETPSPEVPVLDVPPIEPAAPDTGPSPPPPPDAPRDAGDTFPLVAFEAEAPNATPEEPDTEDPEDEPLWKRLANEREAPAPPPIAAHEEAKEDEPLWKRFAASELAAKLPPPPETDPPAPDAQADDSVSPALDEVEARVLGAGARDRRDWFVTELFDGSPSAYHRTLDRIDRAPSYTEATHIVSSDIFRAHSVNPYTDSAVAFIDAMQVQFDVRR